MPREGKFKKPISFPMRDLSLDVSLIACHESGFRDFTGKKTFNTSFFRENIGFGITDIQISINPSLQPLVEITFKDLYGNTIFGTQRGYDNEMDTSVIFAWPPPKFIFSFKGYLGRKVTWILNLKTNNISYVPSDGSYEIKCSFVPNQWGFFADIPFLYLIASKKLRANRYKNPTGDLNSIFSFIRIGKHVEVKTQEITKEFDALREQINAIKYNVSNAIYGSNVAQYDTEISGVINGSPINGFESFFIKQHSDLSDEEAIRLLMKRSEVINRLNTFILLNIQKTTTPNSIEGSQLTGKQIVENNYTLNDVATASAEKLLEMNEQKNKVLAELDKNLTAIETEIKKRVYNSSKTQIAKLTIGEVFSQIAKDTAFILGCILEEGLRGAAENPSRNTNIASEELIGKSFPLIVNSETNEEDPALIKKGSKDYGVENNEWKFVNEFIEAISQGVAENLIEDDISATSDELQSRINNAEILRSNPYKPFYSNIAENVLIRSGIIAFLTRSDDPNKPGGYYSTLGFDNDSPGSARTLANADMGNLSEAILGQLSFQDQRMLRRFCVFWNSLFDEDGDFCTVDQNTKNTAMNVALMGALKDVPDEILDHKVLVDDYTSAAISKLSSDAENSAMSLQEYADQFDVIKRSEQGSAASILTIRGLFKELFRGKNDFSELDEGGEQPGFINTAYLDINYETGGGSYSAYLVKNNGIYYCYPTEDENTYYFIVFSGDDVGKLNSKNSSKSDGEFDEDEKDDDDPMGMVFITTRSDEKDVTPDRIVFLNDQIEKDKALDYKAMLKHATTNSGSQVNLSQYLWKKKIQTSDPNTDGDYPATNLAFTVYAHQIDTEDPGGAILGPMGTLAGLGSGGSSNLVWAPFIGYFQTGDENPSKNQRVAIKEMCKTILNKLDKIETERNLVIGNVASKASEHAAAMYKQMHTIFHQWQSVASTDKNNPCGYNGQIDGLAERIEQKYGGEDRHQERDVSKKIAQQLGDNVDTCFIYDYPLAPIKGNRWINVKNSVINIEPIYSPNADTTVLNIIQQICSKNNFIFVPFPGDPLSDDITDIFLPYETVDEHRVMNYFHVIFAPTPETRVNLSEDNKKMVSDYYESAKNQIQTDAILIQFGGTDNQIFKNISVATDSTKPTAESILNLQRLVDKENTNKNVTMDCSMLPVMEGRSYKASVEMLGCSQVYPMQYFFIDKMPLFGGLHQIMKVTHSITPNNMTTSLEGIRMRFAPIGGYGGIEPITLESLEELSGANSKTVINSMTKLVSFDTYNSDQKRLAREAEMLGTGEEGALSVLEVEPTTMPMEKDKFSMANIRDVFKSKNYNLDINNKVTLIGVRKRGSYISNKFDDFMILVWQENGGAEQTRFYRITTEPGATKPGRPLSEYNEDGIAMMAEGQYVDMYIHGKHKGYDALKQNKPAYFYRQKWPSVGEKYTFNASAKRFGSIGANVHRASSELESSNVYNWSEGCQVFANPTEFSNFLGICKAFTKKYNQNAFTYTLLNEMDFETGGTSAGGSLLSTLSKRMITSQSGTTT